MSSTTATSRTVQDVVRGYHDAWTSGDISTAGDYLAPGFSARATVGSHDAKDAYLAGLTRFRNLVTGVDLISELYGGHEASLLYDVHTATDAGTLRTAEHFSLADGLITSTLLIFDATDWKAMLAGQGATVDADGYVTLEASSATSSLQAVDHPDPGDIVNAYLAAFYTGDFDRAGQVIDDTFDFQGPFVQVTGKDAFFASAAGLLPVVRGHRLRRQWIDGADVVSIYDVTLQGPGGSGSIIMSEWHQLHDGRLTAGRVLFDPTAFRAILQPQA